MTLPSGDRIFSIFIPHHRDTYWSIRDDILVMRVVIRCLFISSNNGVVDMKKLAGLEI